MPIPIKASPSKNHQNFTGSTMLRMITKPAHTQISPGSSRGRRLRLIAITSRQTCLKTICSDVFGPVVLYAEESHFVTAKALRQMSQG
jgi:hypothetical protein